MGEFIIPDGPMLQPVPPLPPPDPRVAREEKIANDTRVESELNRFIASKQDALFNNPDAFYRTLRSGRRSSLGSDVEDSCRFPRR